MDTKIRLLLLSLALLLSIGLSGAVLQVSGDWETQPALVWPVEGDKAGQASFWGHDPGGRFGEALAVGDVNGDGYDDLIASARFVSDITLAGGEVYVIPGPLGFNESYTMPHSAALVFQGTLGDQPQIGAYLDSGDMNGDGIDDIVMGSFTTGKAYAYLGAPDIQVSSPQTVAVVAENMALTLSPAEDGLALCDFNGDGYQDLFVEQRSSEDGIQVWGVLGRATLTMTEPVSLTMPSDANISIQGFYPSRWGGLPRKNMVCGDIDGDGCPDLAIGIWGESPPDRPLAGIVYVLQGDPTIGYENPVTLTMPGQASAIIEGTYGSPYYDGGDNLGDGLAIADIDQDGRADLIMGAPGARGPYAPWQGAGEVYLWLGRALEGQRFTVTSQASWIVHGVKDHSGSSDALGKAISTGDFDNDGYPEILLGCQCVPDEPPLDISGRGYVLEPLAISGTVAVRDVSQLDIVPYRGACALGQWVDAMDLDGDGVSDLVISAPNRNYLAPDQPGTVYVISYPVHFRVSLPLITK